MIKEKFSSLSFREKWLTSLAGLAFFLYALNFGLIEPLYKSYVLKSENLKELMQTQSRLMSLKQMGNENRPKIEIALRERDMLTARLAEAKDNIVDNERLNDILSILGDPATGSDISLISISIDSSAVSKNIDNPEAIENASFTSADRGKADPIANNMLKYERNKISVKIKSGFGSLAYLFGKLFDGPLPLSISKINITRDNSPNAKGVIANFDLIIYTSPL